MGLLFEPATPHLPPQAGQTFSTTPPPDHLPALPLCCYFNPNTKRTPSPQRPTSGHQRAKRPLAHRHSSTHSGPPTSSGATRPRTAARVAVLRTPDLAWALRPQASGRQAGTPAPNVLNHIATNPKCEPTGTSALPGGHDRSIMVRTFLPPSAGQTSASSSPNPTHSRPLTSSGASRPRTAARVAVLRTSDLA